MTADHSDTTVAVRPALELERECETWDWARTAGVSALELLQAVREGLGIEKDDRPRA